MEQVKEENKDTIVIVKLGLKVGDQFASFQEFQEKLDKNSKENFVRFWKRDSRSIEAARRKVKRFLKPELVFYQLKYSCVYGQKYKKIFPRKRKRRSLLKESDTPCSASINLKITENGEFLEICGMVEHHNHPVNAIEYKKVTPRKKMSLQELMIGENGEHIVLEEACTPDDKYKNVIKKCRQIARVASVSSISKYEEIMKNLDDFVYYLKYTTPKNLLETEISAEIMNNNGLEMSSTETGNENIKIIVTKDDEETDALS